MNGMSSERSRSCRSAAVATCLTFLLLAGLSSNALAVRPRWTKTYNGAENLGDVGNSTAVGPDGSVYVAGSTEVAGQELNIWLRKYSPRGKIKWTRTFNGTDNLWDIGRDVTVGPDGNVYVTGSTEVAGQSVNMWLRKYSPKGKAIWTRTYNGAANAVDTGHDVTVGPDGSVYVTGRTDVTGETLNIWLRKYSPRGKTKWTRTFNGSDNSNDTGYGVAAGPDGSVYVTGYTYVAGQSGNIWLRKYSSRGKKKWTKTYGGAANGDDRGYGVAVGLDGSVYVTGFTAVTGQVTNVWLRKYSPRGKTKWTRTFDGAAHGFDTGYDVTVGPDGGIYVTGNTYVAGQSSDIWLRKYSSRGKMKWTKTYNGDANGYDQGNGVAVGADSSIYVTGFTEVPGQDNNIWLRKYR